MAEPTSIVIVTSSLSHSQDPGLELEPILWNQDGQAPIVLVGCPEDDPRVIKTTTLTCCGLKLAHGSKGPG